MNVQMTGTFEIQADDYKTTITPIDKLLFSMSREHNWEENANHIDIFSTCWTLAIGDYGSGDLAFKRGGETHTFRGKWAFFVPPFSILHWQIIHSPLKWKSYTSLAPMPDHFPKRAIAWNIPALPEVTSYREIFDIVESRSHDGVFIDKLEHESTIALRTKAYIDQHFEDPTSIADIAKRLGYSHSVMTRYFKRCYSVSVIKYRNQMRLFNSLLKLIYSDNPICNVAENSGYKDLSKYYRQFRGYFGTSPSSYSYSSLDYTQE